MKSQLVALFHCKRFFRKSNHQHHLQQQFEAYNCSKPDYDNNNIKYHPHSHHICITNRTFNCPITMNDIKEATNFMINHQHHYHHQQQYNHSHQHFASQDNNNNNIKHVRYNNANNM